MSRRIWLLGILAMVAAPVLHADESVFKPDFTSFPTGPAGPHDMLLR